MGLFNFASNAPARGAFTFSFSFASAKLEVAPPLPANVCLSDSAESTHDYNHKGRSRKGEVGTGKRHKITTMCERAKKG
jgi:hypothetical protein